MLTYAYVSPDTIHHSLEVTGEVNKKNDSISRLTSQIFNHIVLKLVTFVSKPYTFCIAIEQFYNIINC